MRRYWNSTVLDSRKAKWIGAVEAIRNTETVVKDPDQKST